MSKKKNRLKLLYTFVAIALLICGDLIIKYFVELNLRAYGSVQVVKGVLNLTYVQNTGAAFGMFRGSADFLSIFTGAILAGLLVFLAVSKKMRTFERITLILIASGGLGNLIDRIMRGYVVDYIQALPSLIDFPVFNFADCLVTVGSFLLIGYLIYDIVLDSRKAKDVSDEPCVEANLSESLSYENTEEPIQSDEA